MLFDVNYIIRNIAYVFTIIIIIMHLFILEILYII